MTASPAAGQNCGERTAAFSAAFDGLPKDLSVVPICPAGIGPGFADPKPAAQFSTLTAGEVTDTSISPDLVALDVLVATLEDGGGEAFVDGLFSRLGADARGGTVTLDGKLVQYINVPGGPTGYAYGAGPTVVIGYVKAPSGPPSSNYGAMDARTAYTEVLAIATGAPLPDIPPPANGLDQWPLARGRFTAPTDPGWIYFRTPTEKEGVLLLLLRNRAGGHPGRLRFRAGECARRNQPDHRRLGGRPLRPLRHPDIHPRRRRPARRRATRERTCRMWFDIPGRSHLSNR